MADWLGTSRVKEQGGDEFSEGFFFSCFTCSILGAEEVSPASLKCQQAQIKNVSTKVALSIGGTCRGQARRTENA